MTIEVAEAGDDAPHKKRRLSHEEWLCRHISQGKKVSPLMSAPGITTKVFRRDWLHNADQGVGADFLGNACKVFQSRMPGTTKKVRRLHLLARIRDWYDANNVKDRIVGLRPWGIQAPKSAPKFKSSAACVRALIPYAYEECVILLSASDPKDQAVTQAAKSLLQCYNCLHHDSADWREVLPMASRDFAIQFSALQQSSQDKDWTVKPKMHQFLEMCAGSSKPNLSWCYRDEDFGGTIAQLCRIKGGCWKKIKVYSSKMLTLFRTLNRVPRIV